MNSYQFMCRFIIIAVLAAGAGISSFGQQAGFFRVAGPVPTTITTFRADGQIGWTNTPTNAIFTVQFARSVTGPWVDYLQVPATNAATTCQIIDLHPPEGMVLVPAGSFIMGNCMDASEGKDFELPLHSVYVSGFCMDKYDVTKELWDSVYAWAINHGYSFDNIGSGKAPNHPVVNVNWYDSVKWCNARSEKAGLRPAYYVDDAHTTVYRAGQLVLSNNQVDWNMGYRLPTEAEWEKAARGGLSGHRFPWGDTISQSQANYFSTNLYSYDLGPSGFNSAFVSGLIATTSPVGYFAPNGYGLYDMAGNVAQMCWDLSDGAPYSSLPQADPHGPTSSPNGNRMRRGGNMVYDANVCRTAYRVGYPPGNAPNALGFRCVLPQSR